VPSGAGHGIDAQPGLPVWRTPCTCACLTDLQDYTSKSVEQIWGYTRSMQTNERLSWERSQAPEPIIDQYLVNVPHKYFKVYGLGDILSPKGATLTVDQRYQNVRIVAVYQTDQVPVLPGAQRS
jgi:hypothetical protein